MTSINFSSKLTTYHKIQPQIESVKGNNHQIVYAIPPAPLDEAHVEFYTHDNKVIANLLERGYHELAWKAEHNYLKYYWKRALQLLVPGGFLIIISHELKSGVGTYKNSAMFIEKTLEMGFTLIRQITNTDQFILVLQKITREIEPTAFTEELNEWNNANWDADTYSTAFQLINQYSEYGNNVLHLFLNYKEFFEAVTIAGRNSLHCGIGKLPTIELQEKSVNTTERRIKQHLQYLEQTTELHEYVSQVYGFKVITERETTLWLPIISQVEQKKSSYKITYK